MNCLTDDNMNLLTKAKNTWCPGCTNFFILTAFNKAVEEMVAEGFDKDKLFCAAGIGCHGKIADYINLNSCIALHGREAALAAGAKLANPELTVVAFAGDGDAYAEGIEHLVHLAKRNSDISLFVHNNQVFGLTTGQATPTSPKGFRGRSTPFGSIDEPLNPLLVLLSSGATFVARAYAPDLKETQAIMKRAMKHRGFAVIDIIQPCITFADTREHFRDHVQWLDANAPRDDFEAAVKLIRQDGEKTLLGIFYEVAKPTFEEQM